MNIFDCLENEILIYETHHPRPYVKWTLPRQCGATSWLVNRARSHHDKEERVLYITFNKDFIKRSYNVNFEVISIQTLLDKNCYFLRGKRYDRVFMDTVDFDKDEDRSRFFASIFPTTTKNMIIHLNTGAEYR